MKALPYLITSNSITFHTEKGPIVVGKENDPRRYEEVLSMIGSGEWDKLFHLLIPKAVFEKQTTLFFINSKNEVVVTSTNEVLPNTLGKRIYDFYKTSQETYKPLVMFWENCKKNPEQRSVAMLYDFLEKNHFPITEDGCFIAYKKVTNLNGKLIDSYTKKISNEIGEIVKMPREKVTFDPRQTCSSGLHVAAWEYAQNYSGNTLLCVKVNPINVVSVPTDYNSQKMRVCEYQVLSIIREAIKTQVFETGNLKLPKQEVKDLNSMTAKEILKFVYEQTGAVLIMNLKNKKAIVKKANQVLNK